MLFEAVKPNERPRTAHQRWGMVNGRDVTGLNQRENDRAFFEHSTASS